VNIGIVGGGPAGLFFAYLMKRHDPGHRIRIVERDPAAATYGWGVVFTDIALAFVREVAPELYAAMTRNQEVHDAMRIVHRGQAITLANNTFHRMARIDLLRTLREHCSALGIAIEFGRRVDDIGEFDDCDLIVAADGAGSAIRTRYREHFEPALDVRPNLLAWYGTTALFDPLSLIFRENDAGLLIAHAYRYSRTHSTFLVECDPQTWERAGFAAMSDEDTREYVGKVFAADLNGNPLLSNNSKWINFLLVKNTNWFFENVVLLGDALHTAHFSIGSGTKLAMEDAIALAHAFQQTSDVKEALASFTAARRPVIEDYQAAAFESMKWFENAAQYVHLSPMELALSVMMRSGRVSYEDLRKRDPQFIHRFNELFPGGRL
jgi:2-polyprenyl-6-methoxyphenol hydroxylase-like FAD-dependent oxidoreductase